MKQLTAYYYRDISLLNHSNHGLIRQIGTQLSTNRIERTMSVGQQLCKAVGVRKCSPPPLHLSMRVIHWLRRGEQCSCGGELSTASTVRKAATVPAVESCTGDPGLGAGLPLWHPRTLGTYGRYATEPGSASHCPSKSHQGRQGQAGVVAGLQ